jgi:hypothetical protein
VAELSLVGFRMVNVDAIVLEFSRVLKLAGVLGMHVLRRFRLPHPPPHSSSSPVNFCRRDEEAMQYLSFSTTD